MQSRNKLLLASNSPRRRQLLSLGGWTFSTAVSQTDETRLPHESPAEYVIRLAKAKARAVLAEAGDCSAIIGADTAVVDGEDILGKPVDAAEAAQFLRRLRSHVHQVYTGIAVLRTSDDRLVTDLCVTDVPMRDYSEQEIDAYVATGDPLDKAGAYAIQHPEFRPVEEMHGCYPSVMGLPLCHLTRMLVRLGLPPVQDVTAQCNDKLNYPCPVFSLVQGGEQPGSYKGEE